MKINPLLTLVMLLITSYAYTAAPTAAKKSAAAATTVAQLPKLVQHLDHFVDKTKATILGIESLMDRVQGIVNLWPDILEAHYSDAAFKFLAPFRQMLEQGQNAEELKLLHQIYPGTPEYQQAQQAVPQLRRSSTSKLQEFEFYKRAFANAQAEKTLRSDPTAGDGPNNEDFNPAEADAASPRTSRTAATTTTLATDSTTVLPPLTRQQEPAVTYPQATPDTIDVLLQSLRKLCISDTVDVLAIRHMFEQVFKESPYRFVALSAIVDQSSLIVLKQLLDLYDTQTHFERGVIQYVTHHNARSQAPTVQEHDVHHLTLQERIMLGLSVPYPSPLTATNHQQCLCILAIHTALCVDLEALKKQYSTLFDQSPYRRPALQTIYRACGTNWRKLTRLAPLYQETDPTRIDALSSEVYEELQTWINAAQKADASRQPLPLKPSQLRSLEAHVRIAVQPSTPPAAPAHSSVTTTQPVPAPTPAVVAPAAPTPTPVPVSVRPSSAAPTSDRTATTQPGLPLSTPPTVSAPAVSTQTPLQEVLQYPRNDLSQEELRALHERYTPTPTPTAGPSDSVTTQSTAPTLPTVVASAAEPVQQPQLTRTPQPRFWLFRPRNFFVSLAIIAGAAYAAHQRWPQHWTALQQKAKKLHIWGR